MKFVKTDGGRAAAGFKGIAGDCVTRAVAIASGKPYQEVYDALAAGNATQRKTKRTAKTGRGVRTAREGIYMHRKWFKDYMASLGFAWVPTMRIGSGCTVHLADGELPMGRLVVRVSKHSCAVIDGVIHDAYDPSRETHCIRQDDGSQLKVGEWRNSNGICWIERRCVYGYWILKEHS